MNLREKVEKAADFIKSKTDFKPEIGIILGSGLGDLADDIQVINEFSYKDIPNFPLSTVDGHSGKLILGTLEDRKVATLKGRVHYYEGYTMQEVTFPVRLMKWLGIKKLILTNASGGINEIFRPGDLMLIYDHINLMGTSPLIGIHDEAFGPRFVDLSSVYDLKLKNKAMKISQIEGIFLQTGVYAAVTGPNYETLAEIKYLKKIGADAVGMSTVPEAIVAAQMGLKTLGISCITDVIHSESGVQSVSHEEVLMVAQRSKPKFLKLMKAVIREI